MPATVNSLTGGTFSDASGNPLANGYLIFTLNQDVLVNTTTQLCSGRSITVPLDANGNVVSSPTQTLWPNDVMTPNNTFYYVSGYNSGGDLQWGPNSQTILSSPSPYNLSAWIPGKI